MICLVTTLQYAIAPVSALLGLIIGAVINGWGSRRTLDRQLAHTDAREGAERFLDLRRDLYARVVANHHELRDIRRSGATIEAKQAELPPLPDNIDEAVEDLESASNKDEAVKTARQQLVLARQHHALALESQANESAELALMKSARSFYGELTLVSPMYVQTAFGRLTDDDGSSMALVLFMQAARWDLEGHSPTKAELVTLDRGVQT